MAWTDSGVLAYYLYAMGTNVVRPSTDSFKVALFGNSVVPAQSTTEALNEYAGASSTWSTANEVSSSGYTAGGVAVSSPTWVQAANVVTFSSAGSPTWSAVTFTAYGGLVYDTTVSNLGIAYIYFGGAQTVSGGSFAVTWNASGIMSLTTASS